MAKGNSKITGEEMQRLLTKPTVSVEEAAAILGLSRNPAYEAVGRGEIPSIRLGRSIKVPSASLRRMLLIDGPAAA